MFAEFISFEQVSWLTYIGVFVAGILISFTPCVYPLIPVVVSYLGGTGGRTRTEAFLRSLVYVLGMTVVYAGLGAAAALSGNIFGEFQNTWWVQVLVANVFFGMALVMLDVFRLPATPGLSFPAAWQRHRVIGPLLIGAISALVMGPCTTPVLGSLLTYVAAGRQVVGGTVLLLLYAFGMGIPLIILGTFAGLISRLPRAGTWMIYVKKIFAVGLMIAAQYILLQVR